MKRFLACLALCASLSASAQGDNCTVLGIQDLTQMVFELQTQLNAQDATIDSLQNAAMTRDAVRAIARGELAVGGSAGLDDLSGADLSGADLSFADLSFADLSGADLSGADLSYANLIGANLTDADLFSSNLNGTFLTCLQSCPLSLPSGYTCEPNPDCSLPDRYRIVPE